MKNNFTVTTQTVSQLGAAPKPLQPFLIKTLIFSYAFYISVKLRENRGREQSNMTILTDNIFKKEEADTMREEWRMAAMIINRLFAWIYLITIIITLLAVLLKSPRFRKGEL